MIKKNYQIWFNKSMLIFLAVLIVGTSLTGLAMAKGESIKVGNLDSLERPEELINSTGKSSPESSDYVMDDTEKRIEQIKEKSIELKNNRLRKEDTFNYTKADIEKLILAGATVEDIYLSDQIANEWLIDPNQLVELKLQNDTSWEKIAGAIQSKKEDRLNELLKQYPTAEKKFSGLNMNLAEKVEVLETVEETSKGDLNKANLDKVIEDVSTNKNARKDAYSLAILDIQEEVSK